MSKYNQCIFFQTWKIYAPQVIKGIKDVFGITVEAVADHPDIAWIDIKAVGQIRGEYFEQVKGFIKGFNYAKEHQQ